MVISLTAKDEIDLALANLCGSKGELGWQSYPSLIENQL